MAQLGARLHGMQKVEGSSPSGSSPLGTIGYVDLTEAPGTSKSPPSGTRQPFMILQPAWPES